MKTRREKQQKKKIKNKTRKNNSALLTDKCAPKRKFDFTCYDKKSLNIMRKAWNKSAKKNKTQKIKSKKPKEIWQFFKDNISTCKRESCWLQQPFIKPKKTDKLKYYTFAPKYPDSWYNNKTEWLNSLDIQRVMRQYKLEFPEFDFKGPSPIDYDSKDTYNPEKKCVQEDLCKFDLKSQIQSGKTKVGIIFNLDPHNKGGSHWVALFVDCKKHKIYYFDSYGDPIPERIMRLVKTVKEQAREMKKKFSFYYNDRRHQYKNSECGMYCLYFIIALLKNKPFNTFLNKRIKDEQMEETRKKYFNYKESKDPEINQPNRE